MGGREESDHIAERGQTIDIKEPDEFTAHAEQRSVIAWDNAHEDRDYHAHSKMALSTPLGLLCRTVAMVTQEG